MLLAMFQCIGVIAFLGALAAPLYCAANVICDTIKMTKETTKH